MVERPKSTARIIEEVTGRNQGLISSLHHGLYETPLNGVYPYLDFNETVAFAANSWKSRNTSIKDMGQLVSQNDLYEIFSEVFRIGMPWLNKYKAITLDSMQKYTALNPFEGKNLKERLAAVPSSAVEILKKRLCEDVNEYVFHCQYQQRKNIRGGDNYKLEIMNFQNVYPKSGKIVPAFASEIARIFSTYPRTYNNLQTNQLIEPATPELPDANFDIPEDNLTTEEYLKQYEEDLQNGNK